MDGIVAGPEVDKLLYELTTMLGREDPSRYHRLREISPIVRAVDGALVVTRYADCSTLTRDPRFAHPPADVLAFIGYPDWRERPALEHFFTSMLVINPPDHTRLRRLVSGAFTARRVQALRPAIERMVDDLLDTMSGSVDFIEAFAFRLPVDVIGELLGVPAPDRAQFQTLIRDWAQVLDIITDDVLAKADPAAATVRAYLRELVAPRRRSPQADLISALVAVEEAGEQLTEDELLTTAALLFAAGFETTTNLLANGLVALLQHPSQLALLRDRPELAAPAVEELLRFDSPVQLVSRVVMDPIELGGVTVGEGERVVAYLGAGNRDPSRFADPDFVEAGPFRQRAALFRRRDPLLPRRTTGAIVEAQIALPALIRRFPRIALNGEPERRDSLSIKGFTRLPVDLA